MSALIVIIIVPILFIFFIFLAYQLLTFPEYVRKVRRGSHNKCGKCRATISSKQDYILIKNPVFGPELYACKKCNVPLYSCEGVRCTNYATAKNSYCPECSHENHEKGRRRRIKEEAEADRRVQEQYEASLIADKVEVQNQMVGKCPYCSKRIEKPILVERNDFTRSVFKCPNCKKNILKCNGNKCEDYAKTGMIVDDFFCDRCSLF